MRRADDRLTKAERALQLTNPTQVDLKGAVTDAYYALFFALIDLAVEQLAPGQQELGDHLARSFEHKTMKAAAAKVCDPHWGAPEQRAVLGLAATSPSDTYPANLAIIGRTFISLQEARHKADYDRQYLLTFTTADELVQLAQKALILLGANATDARWLGFSLLLVLGDNLTRKR